jgi:hypothetical protein
MSAVNTQQALHALEAIATAANSADGNTHRALATILGDEVRLEHEVMRLLTVIQQIGAIADGALDLLGGSVVRGDAIDWFAPEVKQLADDTTQGEPA